jgi:hypothetical protein
MLAPGRSSPLTVVFVGRVRSLPCSVYEDNVEATIESVRPSWRVVHTVGQVAPCTCERELRRFNILCNNTDTTETAETPRDRAAAYEGNLARMKQKVLSLSALSIATPVLMTRIDLKVQELTTQATEPLPDLQYFRNPIAGYRPSDNLYLASSWDVVSALFATEPFMAEVTLGKYCMTHSCAAFGSFHVDLRKPQDGDATLRSRGIRTWMGPNGTQVRHRSTPAPGWWTIATPMVAIMERRVAVCIVGQFAGRPVLDNGLWTRLLQLFHRPGFEYFLSTSGNASVVDAVRRSGRYRDSFVDELEEFPRFSRNGRDDRHGQVTCGDTGRLTHPYVADYMAKLVPCYLMIARAEEQTTRYDYVVRLRPDHWFVKPLPSPEHLLTHADEILMFDDHAAWAARKHARALFVAPYAIYRSCASAAEFKRACQRGEPSHALLNNSRVPCAPMALLAGWDDPATIVQCGFPHSVAQGACRARLGTACFAEVWELRGGTPAVKHGCVHTKDN